MKNILFIPLLFLFVSCGITDKRNLNDEKLLSEDEHVDFTQTNGSFDLSNYLFPKEGQIYEYSVNVVTTDTEGTVLNKHNSSRQDEYTVVDENQIILGENISYFSNDVAIRKEEFINGFYEISEYRRHLDENDVYYSYEEVNIRDNYQQIGKSVCRLLDHNISRQVLDKNYNDVIHLRCEGDFGEGTIFQDFSKITKFKIDGFYARDKGLIESVSLRYNHSQFEEKSDTYFLETSIKIKN